ncbi:MAG TPA: DUF1810 domain-containing protein [Candidatus Aquabacterium excrementipullorum]|nr:DUF1810 domain-containing protein [Candidatus Aquabacterium excrementipullorum]
MTDTFARAEEPRSPDTATQAVHVSGAASDPHNLQRFVDAQTPAIDAALAELEAGHKRGHWMWFVFPQLRGLGRSEMAHRYGIADLSEARAYLRHPVLGQRLRDAATTLLMLHDDQSAHDIFGSPDDLKLRSSMTLFEAAEAGNPAPTVFGEVLRRFYSDTRDEMTLQLLAG